MVEINAPIPSIRMRAGQWFAALNIYADKPALAFREQLVATRLNLIGLTLSLFILIMVRTFTPQTTIVAVHSPSLDQFKHLLQKYPSTLSCPCAQVIIPYRTFLSFTPQYHQVCSSDFISSTWISALFSVNTSRYHPLDFRNGASSQFQILAALCRFAENSVSNASTEFGAQALISSHTMSPALLDAQAMALVARLQATTIANVLRINQYLALNIAGNNLDSILQTNYLVHGAPGTDVYVIFPANYLVENYTNRLNAGDYCACDTTFECTFLSGFYQQTIRTNHLYWAVPPPFFVVPGIRSGCIPSASILQSTLECFYDSFCLNILALLGIQTSSVRPLNSSLPSRFSRSATVQSIFDALFMEEWHNESNFTNYFHACAPATCSYTYADQVNLVTMLGAIISLLGGLIVLFNFLAYLVVFYLLRRLTRLRAFPVPNQASSSVPERQRSIRQRLLHNLHQCHQFFLQLNMFSRSAVLFDMKQKLWTTRVYLLLLVIAFSILTIYSSITVHRSSRTVHNPSQEQFESLYLEYTSSLSCPCSQLSVRYASIVTIQPRFHQVCSSDFIRDDRWLLYFLTIPVSGAASTETYFSQDFRNQPGSNFFHLLQTLCNAASATIRDALVVFNDLQFVSNEPLTNSTFQDQVNFLVDQLEQQTLESFLLLSRLLRAMLEDNQFHSASDPNFGHKTYLVNTTWLVRYKPVNYQTNGNDTCTCLTSNTCIRPQGFYCRNESCRQFAYLPTQSIPGLVISCFPMNSVLLSTLECFYNASCIQMLLDWRLFELADVYRPLVLNVTPLDPHLPSQYPPTTPLNGAISGLLIEDWKVTTNVAAHYDQCRPSICTYTYLTRFEPLHVVTAVLGLIGGLSVVLRLTVPLIVRIVMQTIQRRQQRRNTQISEGTTPSTHPPATRQQSLFERTRGSLTGLDIFATELNHSLWATRIYICLFVIIFSTILLVSIFNQQTSVYIVPLPSESTFEHLHHLHSSHSLSCRCSRSFTSYGSFLNLSARYHQVCSSNFISPDWWTLITSRGDETFLLLDQPLLSNHFRMLSSFCILSKQTVESAINTFTTDTFVSVEPLTRTDFNDQIHSSLKTLIEHTPITFQHPFNHILDTLRANQLTHLFLSNWMIGFSTATEYFVLSSQPLSYNNGTCTCATSTGASCWWQLTFLSENRTNITLPGLRGGCLPVDGLRQSTLECLYDLQCLASIQSLINTTFTPSMSAPLDQKFASRFPFRTTQVGAMIDQLFVEEWINTSNYSHYYQTCSPGDCRYTLVERETVPDLITSLLGFYGGVTLCLRIFVIGGFKLLEWMRFCCRRRH